MGVSGVQPANFAAWKSEPISMVGPYPRRRMEFHWERAVRLVESVRRGPGVAPGPFLPDVVGGIAELVVERAGHANPQVAVGGVQHGEGRGRLVDLAHRFPH